MKHAHTAGPWNVYDQGIDDGPEYQCCIESIEPLEDWVASGIENRADAALIALVPTAPHDCDMPGCPGAENKRRLESWERMLIEHEQNKKLLEAAGELLEAAKTLVSSCRTPDGLDVPPTISAVEDLQDAIRKAVEIPKEQKG